MTRYAMAEALVGLYEHNNWANQQIIEACSVLGDEQLDALPHSATWGSIRQTLLHLVQAQRGYLSLLTLPPEERLDSDVAFGDLAQAAAASGDGLLALVKGEAQALEGPLRTRDGHLVKPWVVLV